MLIRLAGFSYAGGVIMGEYDGGGIMKQGPPDDFTRVYTGPVYGAGEEFFKADHTVAVIQKQAGEHLLRIGA